MPRPAPRRVQHLPDDLPPPLPALPLPAEPAHLVGAEVRDEHLVVRGVHVRLVRVRALLPLGVGAGAGECESGRGRGEQVRRGGR